MSHECDVCGEEFDSARGMKIHAGRVHDESGDEGGEDAAEASGETDEDDKALKRTDEGLLKVSMGVEKALLLVFMLGLGVGFLGGLVAPIQGSVTSEDLTNSDRNTPENRQAGSPENQVSAEEIPVEGEPVLGSEDAEVTLVVYEDLQCPFCRRFETGPVKSIESEYVDSGQVRIVWKDFPLEQIHPWAEDAARATECVYREGGNEAFWPVKDRVFQNQESINTQNVIQEIKGYAADEGVSESAVQSCLDNGNPGQEVQEDLDEGRSNGVQGTPTSFVGEERLVGAQPFSRFSSVIDSQLSQG